MNFDLNDEQQQLAHSLARLLDGHASFAQRRAVAATDAGWSPALWARLAELGLTGLGIPEDCGGLGGDAADRLVVMQAAGRALWLQPYLASAVLASTAVRTAGSALQLHSLLPAMASGELRLAWAHDEATARGAPGRVETRARRQGEQWLLEGCKPLVLHATAAQRLAVSARVQGAAGDEQGLALFLVDAGGPGVHLRPYRLIDDTPAGALTLAHAAAEPLGDPADSARAVSAIQATQAAGMAAVCADMVGTMETAFGLTTAYVNTRQQFGRVIGEYQALRHRIAEMAVGLALARSMAMAAASAVDHGATGQAASDLPRAKLVVGRHARTLCEAAIQLHGGIGMTEDCAVGHALRRVQVLDQLFGDVHAQAALLAGLSGSCAAA